MADGAVAAVLPRRSTLSRRAAGAVGAEQVIAALAAPARTLVLLGESGAGKSRLANALLGREALATGAVRVGDVKGVTPPPPGTCCRSRPAAP